MFSRLSHCIRFDSLPECINAFFLLEMRVGGERSSQVFLNLSGHSRLVFFCSFQHIRIGVFGKSCALFGKSAGTAKPYRLLLLLR